MNDVISVGMAWLTVSLPMYTGLSPDVAITALAEADSLLYMYTWLLLSSMYSVLAVVATSMMRRSFTSG